MFRLVKFVVLTFVGLIHLSTQAQISNTSESAGSLLSHAGQEMGRLAVIETLGDYVITMPEAPSSPPNSDFLIRAWDISDPRNPVEIGRYGKTNHIFNAHGAIKRGKQLFIGGWPNNALELNDEGGIDHVRWNGPEGIPQRGGMMRPWGASFFWSYGVDFRDAELFLDGEVTAKWDHLGQTGVIGFPLLMGDLLIYASDQSNSGVASYDISDPYNPVLLDVFNQPEIHPTIVSRTGEPVEWGVGGYWAEIHGHYAVFARRANNPGIQVVDFSDPSNLRMHCEFLAKDPKWGIIAKNYNDYGDPMYMGFQDEYVFAERYKLNIETCSLELILDEVGKQVETSQYSRPIGNLLLTGGMANWRIPANSAGMGIWAHQDEPDTRPPYVAYHIPQPDRTNYPVMAPISLMIPESLRAYTIVPGETLTVTEVGGEQVDIDYVLSHTGLLTVDPIEYLKDNTTYEVRLAGIQDVLKNPMEEYTFRFSTGPSLNQGDVKTEPENTLPVISELSITPDLVLDEGGTVSIFVQAQDSESASLEYRFNFDDGHGYSAWSSAPSVTHSFPLVGSYRITVQVRDEHGGIVVSSENITVLGASEPVTLPLISSPLVCDQDNDSVWAINPDNNTMAHIMADGYAVSQELDIAEKPQNIALDYAGNLWVTSRDADSVNVYTQEGNLVKSINTGYGSSPYGIVINPSRKEAYVSLYGSGELVRIHTETMVETGRLTLGPTPSALSLSADYSTLLVTRFISPQNWGEIWQVNTVEWALKKTLRLDKDISEDTLSSGRGVPNYLASVAIHPNGDKAYVVGKKDNVDRSVILWRGINSDIDLDDDNSVRAFVATIDLTTGRELYSQRFDIDNSDSPSALTFSPNAEYLFVALQGNNKVLALDIFSNTDNTPQSIAGQFITGLAPQGVCMLNQRNQLITKNLTDRTVSGFDLSTFINGGNINVPTSHVKTVANEKMDSHVLAGKAIFYNASDERMSAEGYISCATCHIDGSHDGRTFDFTGRGEGLRNTTSLLGRGGNRFGDLHWSANFDEVQDFEHDIRGAFLGSGFLSDDEFAQANTTLGHPKKGLNQALDDLAAYVNSLNKSSLPKSPYRKSNGELTEQAIAGQTTFSELNCTNCHRGKAFTDGVVHNVGTLRGYSGSRLGGELPGIKTPSLLGVFSSAPYFHDGSAASLYDVFTTVGGDIYQAENADINGIAGEIASLEYLRESSGVALLGTGKTELVFDGVDGGPGGSGFIRFRYSSTALIPEIQLTVNGVTQTIVLSPILQIQAGLNDSTQGNYIETSGIAVVLAEGTNNVVTMTYLGGTESDNIIVDDLTVSHSDHVARAQAHTVANQLSPSDKEALVQYLLQIDRDNAPEDDEVVELGATPLVLPLEASVESIAQTRGIKLSWSFEHQALDHFQIDRDGQFFRAVSGYEFDNHWLVRGQEYSYQISAIDSNGEVLARSDILRSKAGDFTAPTSPTNLNVVFNGKQGFNLSWTASMDDNRVAFYRIYRNGQMIGLTGGATTFTNNWAPIGDHTYHVVASDAYDNRSEPSDMVDVTRAPTAITLHLQPNAESRGVELNWSTSVEGVFAYRIYRDGVLVRTMPAHVTRFENTWLPLRVTYEYYLIAVDRNGRALAHSPIKKVMAGDSTSPDAPENLTVTFNGVNGYNLSWSAANDESDIALYRIYRNGVFLRSTPNLFLNDWWAPQPNVTYRVLARDIYQNVSEFSVTVAGVRP